MASVVKVMGSQTAISKVLGCTPQNVQKMCATGHVPAKHVLRIEAASGVSRTEIRPDLYPAAPPTLNTNLRSISTTHQSTDGAGFLSSTAQASQ
ncbi:YdaS family helix-turn-helix protein [Pseudomonas sp. 10B1]|nr:MULTISPECIES: YdaS family helix-turn-helix protein [unclassified Pseudomonas]MEB0088528.1 YdaS family helix-turn-helix protein [Pseudomonas sp. RTI1]MEB0154638.1 YdaS family helix-turn-helix protein [Pseudomonas sp. CCC4.3]MDY7560183.1 YdaS family helix-turn-helix protein [Pseudomonas sp. AB6]MEA9994295.1 YdaS family helix-turn-helix protein [Pseudomonas sp. AA4]MEB0126549.1 YdaS family helix-turn-helix protein [Pseudomonas sp. CCC1.2]